VWTERRTCACARGKGTVDERSDVYSVGAMLYHLLGGRAPYVAAGTSSTPREILAAVLRGDPAPLERVAPDVARELASVCAKAMARDRARRYATMAELADDLRAFLENRVVRAHATGAFVELRKWMQRHRGVVAVLGVLFLVVLGAAIGFAVLYDHARDQRDLARRRLAFLEQNPSGYRVDLSGIPTLNDLVEDFEDGTLDLPLRTYADPALFEPRDGGIVIHRTDPETPVPALGLNDSLAVIRGDFELSVAFELEGFDAQDQGRRIFGVNVRRARDGVLVANVLRQARVEDGERFHEFAASLGNPSDLDLARARESAGGLRIKRTGHRVSTWWREASTWHELAAGEADPDELMFLVYAGGDEGAFRVRVDDLRFARMGEDEAALVVHETFDEGLGSSLLATGRAGVAAAVDGRLELECLANRTGESGVTLHPARYHLPGDFVASVDYELVEFEAPPEGTVVLRFLVTSDTDVAPTLASLALDASRPGTGSAEVASRDPVSFPAGSTGQLRLRREGARLALEHWDGAWREALAAEVPGDLRLTLHLATFERPATARVAVDELRIEGVHRRR
jgi:hypothetical protein